MYICMHPSGARGGAAVEVSVRRVRGKRMVTKVHERSGSGRRGVGTSQSQKHMTGVNIRN